MDSDVDLIVRSLAGDDEAFVEMITRHERAIGRYLVRQVGEQAAPDVQGEVWVQAFSSRASYDRAYPDARPWLYGIALNQVRRQRRAQRPEDLVPDLTDLPSPWDPWPAVEMRVTVRTALQGALAELRPEERDVLMLVAGQDLTAADAARALGVPAGTARRLLHQARTSLRGNPQVAALLADLHTASPNTHKETR